MNNHNNQINYKLREKLHEITGIYLGDQITEQIASIQTLQKQFNHSIELVREAVVDRPETWNYNCYRFAFGRLDQNPVVNKVTAIMAIKLRINAEFVKYLQDYVLKEIPLEKVVENDIVIYYNNNKPCHAGLIAGPNVISKWGEGHTWRHGLFEVPKSYGNVVRFYRQISQDEAVDAFLNYTAKRAGADKIKNILKS